MNGIALRKHRLLKIAASVFFMMFISGNETCHTTDAPKRMSRTIFSNVNKHTINASWGPEKYKVYFISYLIKHWMSDRSTKTRLHSVLKLYVFERSHWCTLKYKCIVIECELMRLSNYPNSDKGSKYNFHIHVSINLVV